MFLVDSHCHLNDLNYVNIHKNIDDVLKKAFDKDVKFLLSVSNNLSAYKFTRRLIRNHNNVVVSCGIHPNYIDNLSIDMELGELNNLASENDVVAIGETGLDYCKSLKNKIYQQEYFCNHIYIGRKLNKPVIIHTRNAYDDTIKILKEEKVIDCSGVVHCFTGNIETANKLLDLGLYISFSGIITFSNIKHQLYDVVNYIPLNRLLLETDSPYLTPVPYRGKENQPALVRNIAEYIATLRNININYLAQVTTENFFKLFHINKE